MVLHNVYEARQFVIEHFNATHLGLAPEDEWTVVDSDTVERAYGWIFNCQSRKYVETKDSTFRVRGGPGGVVVDRDGSIHVLLNESSRQTRFRLYDEQRNPSLIRRFMANIYL